MKTKSIGGLQFLAMLLSYETTETYVVLTDRHTVEY